jgi:hypothetical protein
MTVGTMISAIGAGLLITLQVDSSTAYSTGFMFLFGMGAGIGANMPFTALQAAIRSIPCRPNSLTRNISLTLSSDEDMAVANGITVFFLQLGSAMAYAICQTAFITKIFSIVENNPLTSSLSRAKILAAGAQHLEQLTTDPAAVLVVRSAYMAALRDAMVVALVSVCLSHLALPGMEWLRIPTNTEDSAELVEHREDEKISTV